MSSKDKKHNRYIKIHSTKLLIRFLLNEISVWNFNITFILPYIFTVATFYCVNIDLKLAITINVRRYFDFSKITGETRGRAFLFYFFNDNVGYQCNSKRCSMDNNYLWTTAVYLDFYLTLKSTMCGKAALSLA